MRFGRFLRVGVNSCLLSASPILQAQTALVALRGVGDSSIVGAGWARSAFAAGTVIDVELLVVHSETTPEEGELPAGESEVCPDGDFWVEVWVSQVDGGTEGIAGGTVDVLFAPTAASAQELDHGSIFGSFSNGTIDKGAGLVDDLGGATLESGHGVSPDWALLARVRMTPTGAGLINLELEHGAFHFALAEAMGPLPDAAVNLPPPISVSLIDLDDEDACTDDVCNAETGEVTHTPVECRKGQVCDPETGKCTSACGPCPTDANGNGETDPVDLATLLAAWGPCNAGDPCECLDANGDGALGPLDLATLLAAWGPCP